MAEVVLVVAILFGITCAIAPARVRTTLLRLMLRATAHRPPVTTEQTAFEKELALYASNPAQYKSQYKLMVQGTRFAGLIFVGLGIFSLWYFS